ncbi:MAG: hypothetical protein C0483_16995 [Pirellula sp.]|nr:hypothetical protein [Pirellula sp.]
MNGLRVATTVRGCRSATVLAVALVALVARPAAAQYPQQTLITTERTIDAAEWLGTDRPDFVDGAQFVFAVSKKDAGAAEERSVAPRALVAWGAPKEQGRGAHVVLVHGGVLAVESLTTDAEFLECTSPGLGTRKFALTQVRGIVFAGSGSRAARRQYFDAVLHGDAHGGAQADRGAHADRDRLVTLGDDELTGTVTSIDFRGVALETSLGPVVMELAKAAYLVFNPALAAPAPKNPEVRTLVGLLDGSLLTCSAVAEESDRVQLKLFNTEEPTDAKPWHVGRSEVFFLQTLGGDAVYLSDLEATGYRHVPYLERTWDYGVDTSVGGGPLCVGGKRYFKGLGMHSTSRLSFPIAAGMRKFAAELALDDDAEGRGSVTFRVFVDKEERYRSEIIRGGQTPLPMEVDVAGGSQLSLIVDFADHGDEQDHADWLNARLVP